MYFPLEMYVAYVKYSSLSKARSTSNELKKINSNENGIFKEL